VYPGTHVQSVILVLLEGDVESSGHAVHSDAPDAEYFPATHAMQSSEELPAVLTLYVPAEQAVQLSDPEIFL
jgi:hypothetical protein